MNGFQSEVIKPKKQIFSQELEDNIYFIKYT